MVLQRRQAKIETSHWAYTEKWQGNQRVVFSQINNHSFNVRDATEGYELARVLNDYHNRCAEIVKLKLTMRRKKCQVCQGTLLPEKGETCQTNILKQ